MGSNLTTAETVDDVIAQIIAVNETAVGYASDFSESSFNKVQGIRELEENFFPHEDLVRAPSFAGSPLVSSAEPPPSKKKTPKLAPPSSAETWTSLKILTGASVLVTLVNRN